MNHTRYSCDLSDSSCIAKDEKEERQIAPRTTTGGRCDARGAQLRKVSPLSPTDPRAANGPSSLSSPSHPILPHPSILDTSVAFEYLTSLNCPVRTLWTAAREPTRTREEQLQKGLARMPAGGPAVDVHCSLFVDENSQVRQMLRPSTYGCILSSDTIRPS